MELKADDPSLLLPILDAVGSLRLSPESLLSVTSETLEAMEAAEPAAMPAIVRFLVHSTAPASVPEIVGQLRLRFKIDCSDSKDDITTTSLSLDYLSQGFRYRSDLVSELFSVLSADVDIQGHGAADVYLLLSAFGSHKKATAACARKKAVNGTLSRVLVEDAIQHKGSKIEPLIASALGLADALLRAPEHAARVLGGALYAEIFAEFKQLKDRQEVVAQLTTHVGSGVESEVDEALLTLQMLTGEYRAVMVPFAPFLFSILDALSDLTISQVRRLFIVLFNVHEEGGGDNVLIVIRKYLSHASLPMKRIGIIGATAFVVVKSSKMRKDHRVGQGVAQDFTRRDEDSPDTEMQEANNAGAANVDSVAEDKKYREIEEVLLLAQKSCKNCIGLLYDELGLAIRGNQVAPTIKESILLKHSEFLEDIYIGEIPEPAEDSAPTAPVPPPPPIDGCPCELRFNVEKDPEEAPVFMKLMEFCSSSPNEDEPAADITALMPLLSLLSSCYDPRFGGEGLGEIDAAIGAPIQLPAESVAFDYQDMTDEDAKVAAVKATFHGVNWVRELLNSFVHDAAFPNLAITHPTNEGSVVTTEIRDKVVRRIGTLLEMEDDLMHMATYCDAFCPPGAPSLESAGFSRGGVDGREDDIADLVLPPAPNTEDMDKEQAKEAKAEHRKIVRERRAAHKKLESELAKGENALKKVRGGASEASAKEEWGSMMTYKTDSLDTIMRVAGSATSAMRKPQRTKRVRNDEA
jgi:Fanconi anemia group D2 protein